MLVNTSRVLGMEKIILKRPKRGREHFRLYRRCIPRCLCALTSVVVSCSASVSACASISVLARPYRRFLLSQLCISSTLGCAMVIEHGIDARGG